MDFFDGVDKGRYADFKVQYLNSLQIKMITAPTDLNTLFNLANNWLKPKALPGGRVRQHLCYKGRQGRKEINSERRNKERWG
jgi:hypothetical protein